MTINVENIVILGGGSAGWMSASTLVRAYPNKNITLIESESIPTVGVGESTVSEFNVWTKYLGITSKDFLKDVDGSFKFAIGFTNFKEKKSETFFYPFGNPDLSDTVYGLDDWDFKKSLYPETKDSEYVRYFYPQSKCFYSNKVLLKNVENLYTDCFIPERDVSFQIDASKFGQWLANNYAMPRGVKRIIGTVKKINGTDQGITSLVLEDGQEFFADLFVDCTGFKSLLLGDFFKEEFIKTDKTLPNNKAWACSVPYTDKDKELQTFTNGTALKNGWVWNIPLWSRIGSGYVYCDKFIDDESALQEFKDHLDSKDMVVYDKDRSKKLNFRQVYIKNGYYKRPWVKNVVAIGLSSGFLEPLESTGLMITHMSLMSLVDSLDRGSFTSWDSNVFNKKIIHIYKEVEYFVSLHFGLSKRDDTEYWKYMTSKEYPDDFYVKQDGMFGSNSRAVPVGFGFRRLYETDIFHEQMSAMDFRKGIGSNNQNKRVKAEQDVLKTLDPSIQKRIKKIELWDSVIEKCPSHYEYLRDNVYYE